MAIEIIAGRLIARYVGVSLYTWTSVIGVVLAGISFGNYIGGRIAGRFCSQRALSVLFILASIGCVFIPALNNLMGNLTLFLNLSFPVKIAMHAAIIFFLPSSILGMISPVVAKFALDQGFESGRTIGNIYAWSACGSIVGTFVTGFFLIAHIGTIAIIWTIAGFLGVVGLLYRIKNVFSYIWLVAFIFLVFISFSPLGWANTIARNFFLIETPRENIIYEKDSQYSYIKVAQDENNPDVYHFVIDSLIQTSMNIKQTAVLDYANEYYQIFADIIKHFSSKKNDISTLTLGGGGYLFPRYLERYWPTSHIEVVEIDQEITKAAIYAFALSKDSSIRINHMDARNYIEDLTRRKRSGENILPFDFIFCDVFSGGLAIPYHLTTYEFNEKIAQLLAPDGLYVVNLVDSSIFAQAVFLRTAINTMNKTFPYIYVISTSEEKKPEERGSIGHNTYVLIGSQKELDTTRFESADFSGRMLSVEELASLKNEPKDIILTDNYAPVDNLMLTTFRIEDKRKTYVKLLSEGIKLIKEKKLEEAIKHFEKMIGFEPTIWVAYNNIGTLKAWQGRYDEAIQYYKKALDIKPGFGPVSVGLGDVLEKKGRIDEAIEIYHRAIDTYPKYPNVYVRLGNVLIKQNKIDEAMKNYNKALEINSQLQEAKIGLNLAIIRKAEMKE